MGIKKLLGENTPFVKKRYLMKRYFGEYRHIMRTSLTLEQTRLKLIDVDMNLVEDQLGIKIPYRYQPPDVENTAIVKLRSICV